MPRRKLWVHTVPVAVLDDVDVDLIAEFGQYVRDAEVQVREVVELARYKGVTWSAIGAALGVSASAACQRFGKQDTTSWVPWDLRVQLAAERSDAAGSA